MRANNFTVACIHGDMSVLDREETMKEFRSGKSKVLIATDIIGRGIDVHRRERRAHHGEPRHQHQQ